VERHVQRKRGRDAFISSEKGIDDEGNRPLGLETYYLKSLVILLNSWGTIRAIRLVLGRLALVIEALADIIT
jgi:hypothetical protein